MNTDQMADKPDKYVGLKKIQEFEFQWLSSSNYRKQDAINEMLFYGWILLAVHECTTFFDGGWYKLSAYILGAYEDLPVPKPDC